jgi:hypothetical protein
MPGASAHIHATDHAKGILRHDGQKNEVFSIPLELFGQ